MILLEKDLPGPLNIKQVNFKIHLPSKKIRLSRTTRLGFIWPLMYRVICAWWRDLKKNKHPNKMKSHIYYNLPYEYLK